MSLFVPNDARLPYATEVACESFSKLDAAGNVVLGALALYLGEEICVALGGQRSILEAVESTYDLPLQPSEKARFTLLQAIGVSRMNTERRSQLFSAWVAGCTGPTGIAPFKPLTLAVGFAELETLRDPHNSPQVGQLMRAATPRMLRPIVDRMYSHDDQLLQRPHIA